MHIDRRLAACPTRPRPKPSGGVMIAPKTKPTPAEGPKVATDAPPIFVVAGPQMPATSRRGGLGWGNFAPRQCSASSQACSFQGVNRSTVMCQPKSTKHFEGQTHFFQPRSSCLRASRSYKRRCSTGSGSNGQGVRFPPTYAVKL